MLSGQATVALPSSHPLTRAPPPSWLPSQPPCPDVVFEIGEEEKGVANKKMCSHSILSMLHEPERLRPRAHLSCHHTSFHFVLKDPLLLLFLVGQI